MIVMKAAQEKVLAVLQSVAGIVERRHALPILSHYAIRDSGSIDEPGEIAAPVLVHAPKLAGHDLLAMCKSPLRPRFVCGKRGNRRRRSGASCWRLVGDGSTRKRVSA